MLCGVLLRSGKPVTSPACAAVGDLGRLHVCLTCRDRRSPFFKGHRGRRSPTEDLPTRLASPSLALGLPLTALELALAPRDDLALLWAGRVAKSAAADTEIAPRSTAWKTSGRPTRCT